MINGSVYAIVILILIPTINANPTAAKYAKMTRPTPNNIIPTLDSMTSNWKTKITEKTAIMMMLTATSKPLLSVISFNIRPVVRITPVSVCV